MESTQNAQSKDAALNITIKMNEKNFAESNGLFPMVREGLLTELVKKFTQSGQPMNPNDILQLLVQKDEGERTPIDLACYLGYKNIALYLLSKMGKPSDFVQTEFNIDKEGRSCFHIMCYKGQDETLAMIINYERECLKKSISDELQAVKSACRLKALDVIHGQLNASTFHDADTVRRHMDFNIRVTSLFEKYANMIVDRYRAWCCQKDRHGRNALHYVAMSKYTKCFKTLKNLFEINIDSEPHYDAFLKSFMEIGGLDDPMGRAPFDPRKTHGVVKEFQHFLDPKEYNQILKDFKGKIHALRKESLTQMDLNQYTPLHISSYYGDFKASSYMVELGASTTDKTFAERPLEVSRDKFSRGVLQNLNAAAGQANTQDVKFLVNCGNNIDMRQSITSVAPVHRAVLSNDNDNKNSTLSAIITCNADLNTLDSNGWTALIHASYNGYLESAKTLIDGQGNGKGGASVNAYSNQQKTALHFAAMKNHIPVIQLLVSKKAKLEAKDSQHCTPLHLAAKKGSLEAVSMLLAFDANIYAKDERDWTALHYAAYNGHPKVVKQLLTWSVDQDPKLRNARTTQNKTAFNMSANPQTKEGFRIIWSAARDGDLDMVRILIREGQNFDEQTQYGKNTPLHLAAKNGHILIVNYLVELKAQSKLPNSDGKIPLTLAQESLAAEMARIDAEAVKKYGKAPKARKPAVKGSLQDRLEVTIRNLSQLEE